MADRIILDIHLDGRWQQAASVELGAPGHGTASTLDYDLGYVLSHDPALTGAVIGNAAVSVGIPLSLTWKTAPHWPPFLLDILPQGHARTMLAATLPRRDPRTPPRLA